MEVTMTELWLFVWGVAATAYALKRDSDCKNHVQMLHLILLQLMSTVIQKLDWQQLM
jgi:hypothetical protein